MAGKSNKLRIKKLQINFTDKWFYTFVVIISLIAISIGVYATTPNPGHEITQIAPPAVCDDNQFLTWTGAAWDCADAGGSGLWTQTGSDIYYNSGKVGIGTTSPLLDLHVEGSGYIGGHLGIGVTNTAYPLHIEGTAKADVFRAVQFIGDGSGLTNLRVIVTPANDVCNEDTQGLLRYRSGLCSGTGTRSSYFEACMRQGTTSYGWYLVKQESWGDGDCGSGGGCPSGEEWYECKFYVPPGCYSSEPDRCYDWPVY